jgi:HPt (histidine-containing phosphotransfer) domain-containing protein
LKPFAAQDLTALLASAQTADSSAPISSEAVDPALRDPAPTALGLTDPIDPIDPEVLRKLRAMMPAAAVAEIYAAVASDMTPRLAQLTAAMDAGNAVEVVRIAHMIKGGCGMVGLSLATQAAARLETSNLREAWPKELLQLHFALSDLQRILGSGLP